MTREALKKHWDVISAFKDGAEVEFYHRDLKEWVQTEDPMFHITIGHRIKPKPEYVPFDFSDAEFLIGKVVKNKNSDWICMITECSQYHCYLRTQSLFYGELFKNFTFLDGSPCGKLKE